MGSWHSQHWLADDPRDLPAFAPFATFAPKAVSLVILSRENDPALPEMIVRYTPFFGDLVIVVDSAKIGDRAVGSVRFVHQPLDGNFARQRNAGTDAANGSWVLHLDTDETVSEEFCRALPHLAAAAEASDYVAIGFPRRNFVSGTMSDLFPDIQYRLIRHDVCFENRVHERPVACRAGHQTIVSQHGMIDHRMDRKRVRARSAQYDQLGQDPDRHKDDCALLSPFVP